MRDEQQRLKQSENYGIFISPPSFEKRLVHATMLFQWFVKVDNRTHDFHTTNYPHNLRHDSVTFCDRFCVTTDASIQCTNTIIDYFLRIGKLHEQYENKPYSEQELEVPSDDDLELLSSTTQHNIAGDSHYKSYRNSPEYYGAIGSLQQTLLFHAGMSRFPSPTLLLP